MTTEQKIAVMQAYVDGKQIQQQRINQNNAWKNCVIEPFWDWYNIDYRVKPEQKLHPYNSTEEFAEAMKEHGPMLIEKSSSCYFMVSITHRHGRVILPHGISKTFQEMFDEFVWQDGTPCGIMEETK